MNFERKSGILLHITSLPGEWGIGEIGPQARRFAEFLAEAGQAAWQILPSGPIGFGWSPYSSSSAFAGNALLISFDDLMDEGLLTRRHLARFPEFNRLKIDYPAVIEARMKVLRGVCDRFKETPDFRAFCRREAFWLDDYALFVAIREAHHNRSWTQWPKELRDREPAALREARRRYDAVIRRHRILQYLFSRQWQALRGCLRERRIELIGDVPIFVGADSADVWAHRDLFFLNPDGSLMVAAGVPPDYFSKTGQRWGNPLYNWTAHHATGYAWWTERLRRTFELTDTVRIDHFRGFESYWEIPDNEPTAIHGRWVPGPGLAFFTAVEENLRKAPGFSPRFHLRDHVIAENLGIITPEVEALREACGFPGMWVLQFRFSAADLHRHGYRPEGREENWTVYTGTHDNDTTRGWFKHLDAADQKRICEFLRTEPGEAVCALIRLALHAPARRVILPLQDVLRLGRGARMNRPGTTHGNWGWRAAGDMLTKDLAAGLREETQRAGRCGRTSSRPPERIA